MITKPSNPKQAFADRKVPVACGTGALELWDCLGLLEGLLKYGRANWRVAGVRVSTYLDAARRHMLKFAEGEWAAPDTQVPHLVSVRACIGIILDAATASMYPARVMTKTVGGKFLTDDRTPSIDVGAVEAEATRIANHLREMFKDHEPRHMTIDDTHVAGDVPPAAPQILDIDWAAVKAPVKPDANCITTPDGGCVGGINAGMQPCMHDEPTEPAFVLLPDEEPLPKDASVAKLNRADLARRFMPVALQHGTAVLSDDPAMREADLDYIHRVMVRDKPPSELVVTPALVENQLRLEEIAMGKTFQTPPEVGGYSTSGRQVMNDTPSDYGSDDWSKDNG